MTAQLVGSVDLAPNQSIQWFIHGYSAFDIVNFSLTVFGRLSNRADATLIQGQKIQHVDLTQAYLITITNNSSIDGVKAFVLQSIDVLPMS